MTPARLAAARVLIELERGRTTLAAELDRARPGISDTRDRALFMELAAGTLKWRAELDAVLASRSRRPLSELEPRVRAVLRLGAYQLVHLNRIPAHAVVSEAVESIRALKRSSAAGFVNAVLRGLLRPPDPLLGLPPRPGLSATREQGVEYLSTTLSHPRWLVERWLDRYGLENAEAWCRHNNASPSVTVRAVGDWSEDLPKLLRAAGIDAEASQIVPGAVLLPAGALGAVPADIRDRLVVQDQGAQLIALAVAARVGERVLDVCAAPGGKTALLSQAVGADGLVVACDHRESRVALLRRLVLARRPHCPIVRLDASSAMPFGSVFDRVLLDAPCSGLGTLRRDPDVKWTRTEASVEAFASAQVQMLSHCAACVRPGGTIVYATCSSEPEENENVVQRFLSVRTDFRQVPTDLAAAPNARHFLDESGAMRTTPFRDGLDAYFAATLVRTESA